MKLSNFELFTEPFYYNNEFLVFPELWSYPEWDDLCFKENIKPYVISQFTGGVYTTDEFLKIKDINFLILLKSVDFLLFLIQCLMI